MLKSQKNSRKQGDVGLGSAIAYFCKEQWTVALPLTDSQSFDLIVEKNGELKRVQVKTTYHATEYGIYKVALRTTGGNKSGNTCKMFDPSKVELLFVLADDESQYLIPTFEGMPLNSIALGKGYQQYKVN